MILIKFITALNILFFQWPKLLLNGFRAKFKPLEKWLLDQLIEYLENNQSKILASQLREVNLVQRNTIDKTEIAFYKIRLLVYSQNRKNIFPSQKGESKLAEINFTAQDYQAKATFNLIDGVLFSISFDKDVSHYLESDSNTLVSIK